MLTEGNERKNEGKEEGNEREENRKCEEKGNTNVCSITDVSVSWKCEEMEK